MGFNNSDITKYLPEKPVTEAQNLIEQADSAIAIQDALAKVGYIAPEGNYFSVKVYCPWHFEHADQMDKNCRIYERSHLYCFAMHGLMYSTQVLARGKGMTRLNAAKFLLDERGLLQNKPYWQRWQELTTETPEQTGELAYVIQALQLRLKNNPDYTKQEYTAAVRAAWQQCLEKLDDLQQPNYSVLSKWLLISEKIILGALVAPIK